MAKAHIAQVVVKGRVQGQAYRNVMYFGSDVSGWDVDPNAILIALATAVFQCFVEVLLPELSTTVQFDSCTAKRVFPAVTDQVEVVTGAAAGTSNVDSLPSFCASMIDIKTGAGGRRNRGRMFLPPVHEGMATASNLNATGLDHVTAFAQCLVGKFLGVSGTTDWEIGVLSRAAIASSGASIQTAFREATSLTPSSLLSVQRRRKLGVGS